MRIKSTISLLVLIGMAIAIPSVASPSRTAEPARSEVYSALAQLPVSGGTANVKIFINGYSSAQDAERLHAVLADGGPDALLKALRKAKSLGRIERDGTVGFYDFKFILSKDTPNGRHIYAVADRPIGFLEAFFSTRSKDYPFGIMELDLTNKDTEHQKGEGTLIYAAKIRLIDGSKIEVENLTFAPIQLLGVRQL